METGFDLEFRQTRPSEKTGLAMVKGDETSSIIDPKRTKTTTTTTTTKIRNPRIARRDGVMKEIRLVGCS